MYAVYFCIYTYMPKSGVYSVVFSFLAFLLFSYGLGIFIHHPTGYVITTLGGGVGFIQKKENLSFWSFREIQLDVHKRDYAKLFFDK